MQHVSGKRKQRMRRVRKLFTSMAGLCPCCCVKPTGGVRIDRRSPLRPPLPLLYQAEREPLVHLLTSAIPWHSAGSRLACARCVSRPPSGTRPPQSRHRSTTPPPHLIPHSPSFQARSQSTTSFTDGYSMCPMSLWSQRVVKTPAGTPVPRQAGVQCGGRASPQGGGAFAITRGAAPRQCRDPRRRGRPPRWRGGQRAGQSTTRTRGW